MAPSRKNQIYIHIHLKKACHKINRYLDKAKIGQSFIKTQQIRALNLIKTPNDPGHRDKIIEMCNQDCPDPLIIEVR
jgi:hypothetical protein